MERGGEAVSGAKGGGAKPGIDRAKSGAVPAAFLYSMLLSHVPHAFSTRVGGVSSGCFASLNFGNPSELTSDRRDTVANIERNWAIVRDAIRTPRRRVAQVHQVHGGDVVTLRAGDDPCPEPSVKADAIVTDQASILASVRVADCAPVLLASEDGRVVAAVHAGWRGVIAGTATNALLAMHAMHADPGARIVAAIGPCISMAAFEVGPEVLEAFEARFGNDASILRRGDGGKGHVDLRAALRRQLLEAGVADVDVLEGCTMSEPERFFSHRGQSGLTGRMVAVIGVR